MQHILLYVPFSCQSTFLNQKCQQAVCVNEKVENQKQNGDITFCVPVVKKNYCLRVCLLCDSLFRSVTTLGQMVLLLRISSWEMIRLVFNGMQGSKRNSFQWSTRQKRIVSVSRVQGRKKIVFSAVQGKKSCLEIQLQLWQNFVLFWQSSSSLLLSSSPSFIMMAIMSFLIRCQVDQNVVLLKVYLYFDIVILPCLPGTFLQLKRFLKIQS